MAKKESGREEERMAERDTPSDRETHRVIEKKAQTERVTVIERE